MCATDFGASRISTSSLASTRYFHNDHCGLPASKRNVYSNQSAHRSFHLLGRCHHSNGRMVRRRSKDKAGDQEGPPYYAHIPELQRLIISLLNRRRKKSRKLHLLKKSLSCEMLVTASRLKRPSWKGRLMNCGPGKRQRENRELPRLKIRNEVPIRVWWVQWRRDLLFE